MRSPQAKINCFGCVLAQLTADYSASFIAAIVASNVAGSFRTCSDALSVS
jgi:hypothetical protein